VKYGRRTLWEKIRQTDAGLSAVRKAFDDLELVIVQDIFMTKPPQRPT
jgi:predicted molibdopterin-dependent oxidoreductase YjgC